jgi:DNA-binding CsgD family transcriptional regulator
MYWRPIRESDLEECLEIEPACIGDELTGRAQALGIWRELLASPAFQGSVYESEYPIGGHRIIGCGIGVFVDSAFVDRELAAPKPGLNSRIIGSIAAGEPVVLDRDALARGNAGAGLDFVNLYGTWRDGILDPNELAELQTLLGTSFVESLAGYRFNRVVKEALGQPVIELARATGSYRVLAEYPVIAAALVVASPDSARDIPFSVAARLYRYQAPVLHLRPAEQSLLIAALDGKTDTELSDCLGISVEAVKKRWMSVFGRIEDFRPGLLSGADADGLRRGPQKRHRVLAYVRTHPEELRPYAWT